MIAEQPSPAATGREQLFRKSSIFAAVDLIGKALAFGVVAALTRRESPYTFGVIVAGISAASIVQCVVDGGLGVALARAVARRDSTIEALTGSKVTICVGACLPCVAVVGVQQSVVVVPLAVLACAATGAVLLVPAFLAAHNLKCAAIALTGPNALFLVLIVSLPKLSAAGVLFVFAGCNAACGAVTLWAPEVRPTWIAPRDAARIYRKHLANGIYALVTTLYGRLDTVMLAVFGAVAAAGIYGTYFRMVLVAVGLISWTTSLAWRSLADPDLMRTSLIWLEKRLVAPAVAASLALILFGPWALGVVTHGGSLPRAAFILLGLLPVPTVMSAPLGSAMIMSFRSTRLAQMSGVLFGGALCLYLAFIPVLGSTGAALGSLAVEIAALAWMWHELFFSGGRSSNANGLGGLLRGTLRGREP